MDPSGNKRLSIIIPTLNEAKSIKETITQLQQRKEVEIVVVDGGSRDNTVELARLLGARVLQTDASKAVQMNAGAAASVGVVSGTRNARLPGGGGADPGRVRAAARRVRSRGGPAPDP